MKALKDFLERNMEFFKNFFRENTAESMTRLCFFLCIINAIALSWFKEDYGMTGLFLGVGATAKMMQKFKETK